jgi:hypothetical protein
VHYACPAASERPQLSDVDEEAGSLGDGSPGGSAHGSLHDEQGSWKQQQQQQPGDVELQPARRQLPAAAAALLRRGPRGDATEKQQLLAGAEDSGADAGGIP